MSFNGLMKRIVNTSGNQSTSYSISNLSKKWRAVCNMATASDRDALIKVGNYGTLTHSLVLAAVSPFMEAAFRYSAYQSRKVIDLSSIFTSEISLNRIIAYFYCRWVKLDDEFLYEILNASQFLLCEALSFKCSQILLNRLTAENCFWTWIVSEMYHFPQLSLICRDFLRELIPTVTECINVEQIPVWFWDILSDSLTSELCSSAFKLVIQLQKKLSKDSLMSNLLSKLLLNYYFKENSCFSKTGHDRESLPNRFNPLAPNFSSLGFTRCGRKKKSFDTYRVVFVKEGGNPSLALYCEVEKCWASLNLSQDYGQIIGVIDREYLAFWCLAKNKVTLYNLNTAEIVDIKNVFPNYLSWMETYNLSRAYFVSYGKLYIVFSTRNTTENTVLLNAFSYCIYGKKWRPSFHIQVPGVWNMCNLQVLTTGDKDVYITMHAYLATLLPPGSFISGFIPRSNSQSFLFCVDPKKGRMKSSRCLPTRDADKPVLILNKRVFILDEQKLYQTHETPLTWNARLRNVDGDEVYYNVPLTSSPVPRIKLPNGLDSFCISHLYLSSSSLVVAQHRAPTVLWVFTFDLQSRNLVMLPPVPVNATNRNIQVSSFYSPVPISCKLKRTVKTVIRNKRYFKDVVFEDCCSPTDSSQS